MSPKTVRTAALGVIGLLIALLAGSAFGEFTQPAPAPVDRLLRNVEAYIEEHPKDRQIVHG